MTGTTLSHYKITAELGRGGMGIVYRATDTKLNRDVALKILPAAALSSEDDRARFFREAQAAAQLHHAHIATVFEIDEAVLMDAKGKPVGETDGPRPFIAMELIEGETLEHLVKKGPLKLHDAVRFAGEIADALKAAHAKEIVHRDIKCANVMLSADGKCKVLDFGLAKTTHSTMLTRMGSTLGTVAYMSPEQARGEQVDGRTDLWALGILLYEMVAGRLPFAGDYEQAVTYSILNEDPEPLTSLRTGVPMELEWLVSKLLAKSPADRYQRADEILVDLRRIDLGRSGSGNTVHRSTPMEKAAPAKNVDVKWIAGVAISLVFIALAWWLGRSGAPDMPVSSPKRLTTKAPFASVVGGVDVSPDGSMVAFVQEDLDILFLETGQIRRYELNGLFVHVDFSPDNTQVLLTNQASIERVDIASGAFVTVTKTREGGPRAMWAGNEGVVYEEDQEIWYASILTGETRQLVARDSSAGEFDLDYPTVLSDGKTLVASIEYSAASGSDKIGFWDLETGRRRGTLNLPGRRVDWIEPGYLVFLMNGDAMALPFDLDDLRQLGPAVQIDRNVGAEGFSVSQEGTLVHAGSNIGTLDNSRPVFPLVFKVSAQSWSNVSINGSPNPFPAGVYRNAVPRPGKKEVAIVEETRSENGLNTNIWLLNLTTGVRRAMTTDGTSDYPAWSVTGDSLFFVKKLVSDEIWVMASNGRGGSKRVFETGLNFLADLAISPDGRRMTVAGGGVENNRDSSAEFFVLNFQEMLRTGVFDRSAWKTSARGNALKMQFSPDSRYVLYEDQGAVYVQLVEDLSSAPEMIWPNSMTQAVWNADGSGILATASNGGVFRVGIQLDPSFAVTDRPSNDTVTPMTTMGNVLASLDGGLVLAGRAIEGDNLVVSDSSFVGLTLHVITNVAGLLK